MKPQWLQDPNKYVGVIKDSQQDFIGQNSILSMQVFFLQEVIGTL